MSIGAIDEYADPDCYNCKGTGLGIGFGVRNHGTVCPCMKHCFHCENAIRRDDFDEGEPRQYDGVPTCHPCRTKFAAEDAVAP